MKTPMGVFMIKNKENGKIFLDVNADTKNILNRYKFELSLGSCKIIELQKEFKKYGEDSFSFEVLEELEYDEKDDGSKDYSDDLEILKMVWIDKLDKEGLINFYLK